MPPGSLSTPLFAVLIFSTAIVTSSALVRWTPAIKRNSDRAGKTRNESIDGLRGFLALGVFTHHCVVTWYYRRDGMWQVPPSNFYTELGQASVALFFMITAFLFWGKLIDEGPNIDWRHLYLGRIFRLYPAYILMFNLVLVSTFALSGWTLREGMPALLQQSREWLLFTIPTYPDINHVPNTAMIIAFVTWTLRYEWLFYLALPILGLLFKRSKVSIATVVTGFLILLMFRLYQWSSPFDWHILIAFSGGILAAYWVRNERLRESAQSRIAGMIAVTALLICLFLCSTAYSVGPMILLSVLFVVVASGNTLFGVLRRPAIRWLGEVSYSTYLLHGFLVWLVLQRILAGRPDTLYLAAALTTTIALILLSSCSFILVEKPGMALGRSIERQWARPSAIGPNRSRRVSHRPLPRPDRRQPPPRKPLPDRPKPSADHRGIIRASRPSGMPKQHPANLSYMRIGRRRHAARRARLTDWAHRVVRLTRPR